MKVNEIDIAFLALCIGAAMLLDSGWVLIGYGITKLLGIIREAYHG